MNLTVKILKNELWYGGSVADAMKGPFGCDSVYDLNMELALNQTMPLYISTKGRILRQKSEINFTSPKSRCSLQRLKRSIHSLPSTTTGGC